MNQITLSDNTIVPIVSSYRYYEATTKKEIISINVSTSLMTLSEAIIIFNDTRCSTFVLNIENHNEEKFERYYVDGINLDIETEQTIQVRLASYVDFSEDTEKQVMNSYKLRYDAYMEDIRAKNQANKEELERLESEAAAIRQEYALGNEEEREEVVVED